MYNAIVKKLVKDKGFGFLAIEGRKEDLFFHATGFNNQEDFKTLSEGQSVTFKDISNNGRGDSAVGIEIV